ncbi:hypothetical protein ACVCIC_00020 [Burkholderia glumae]|uniref:Uncharacterized protein n=2 Tax=Burkholderia glumae TaxID=337 RepID=A0ABY5BCL7_BURGL|nr:hypothetical protein [Burkholderia glumae]MCM2547236.1 hypothetical protein [Burkholderia glumae]USS44154.1 hypothetical protein NFI99_12775 [Burkholderia glumae]
MTAAEINARLDAVEIAFNKNWLESNDTHRIQKVWHRDDPLATLEILSLGQALLTMQRIDAPWVKEIVRKSREDGNKTHGWIFELIGASMFAEAGMDVAPMPKNFPGYDVEIRFADGYKMKVSFKSHDMSAHEEGFQNGCHQLREIASSRFRGTSPSFFLQISCTNHLDKTRMGAVHEWINLLISDLKEQNQCITLGDTSMMWSAPRHGFNRVALHPAYYSDTIQVFSRQHHREQRRFEKNIFEAEKKFHDSTKQSSDSCHVIMMRVHTTANIGLLATYAEQILNEPRSKADAVWFYQPGVAHDNGSTTLTHTFKPVIHPGRYGLTHQIKTAVPFGKVLFEPTELRLVGPGVNIPMQDSYFFQQADHYSPASKDAQGAMNGLVNSPGTGIRIHSVFENATGSMVLSGKFPLIDELLIL